MRRSYKVHSLQCTVYSIWHAVYRLSYMVYATRYTGVREGKIQQEFEVYVSSLRDSILISATAPTIQRVVYMACGIWYIVSV